ncbi:MAG: LacI family DNA-binding transcriptional regulator [Bifidobacterium sp.]|nr:LacI family DNA-binding transcriptional regulator [Bifidobacterium sp.]
MVGMRDVARRAGVSLSSVSLVVNGTGYVSDELRGRVERAMRELDYVPNDLARSLSRGGNGLVGIIVPTIAHPFFASLTAALQRDLTARGLRTMLCSTADVDGGEEQYVQMLRRRSMDALVVAAHTDYGPDYWTSIDRPIVAFDRWLGDGIPQVRSDHERAGELIAGLLAATGARRVAMVGGPRRQFTDRAGGGTTFPTVRYMTTMERCLYDAGIRHDYAEAPDVGDFAGARRAVIDAFARFEGMDALVGSDSEGAYAVQEAFARGLDVPADLQVVAYDGTPVADMAGVPLTALVQDFDGLAAAVGERVQARIDGRDADDAVVPVTLRRGASTR